MNIQFTGAPYDDQLVQQIVVLVRCLNVLYNELNAHPLFASSQSALSQNNQSGMNIFPEQSNEISFIDCDNRKVILHRVLPN
jgi:hypothetical protein